MTVLHIHSDKSGHTFSSPQGRGRVFVAGLDPLTDDQLRAIASVLLIPSGEPVDFIPALGTPVVVARLAGGEGSPASEAVEQFKARRTQARAEERQAAKYDREDR